MTKFEQTLADAKLLTAYEFGIQHGEDADRNSIQRGAQIDITLRILVILMRQLEKDLEEIMAILQIPKGDWDIYRKILGKRKPKGKK